jgi:hypothetical protein
MSTFSTLRSKLSSTIVTMVVAVQLLNVSIDPVDPSHFIEDLTVNEIESCVELFIEVVLGHGNAIEETEDHDHCSFKPANAVTLFIQSNVQQIFTNIPVIESTRMFIRDTSLTTCPSLKILVPPPKVS